MTTNYADCVIEFLGEVMVIFALKAKGAVINNSFVPVMGLLAVGAGACFALVGFSFAAVP